MIALQGDVWSKESISLIVNELKRREAKVDVLVNNAGISFGYSSVEKGDDSPGELKHELWSEKMEEWEDVYRTNVIS